MRDMTFLPLWILIIVDCLLITATIIDKIQVKYKGRALAQRSRANYKTYRKGRIRNRDYQGLGDEYSMAEDGSNSDMESRIGNFLPRRATGFEELGAMEADFVYNNHSKAVESVSTDLQQFVQSLSKCLGATKFGLSFEFQDLGFKPPKSSKPILSQVSGLINAGSLWGVMGASGAGKCRFLIFY
jgi:ABC-type multidrug transport system fused ATPase/permease subunit